MVSLTSKIPQRGHPRRHDCFVFTSSSVSLVKLFRRSMGRQTRRTRTGGFFWSRLDPWRLVPSMICSCAGRLSLFRSRGLRDSSSPRHTTTRWKLAPKRLGSEASFRPCERVIQRQARATSTDTISYKPNFSAIHTHLHRRHPRLDVTTRHHALGT